MSALSAKQRSALAWIARYGTIPPTEPRTWRSLIDRGLVVLARDGIPSLTQSGRAAL